MDLKLARDWAFLLYPDSLGLTRFVIHLSLIIKMKGTKAQELSLQNVNMLLGNRSSSGFSAHHLQPYRLTPGAVFVAETLDQTTVSDRGVCCLRVPGVHE